MPQPNLHLGDVGLVLQRVGCGRTPQAVHAKARDLGAGDLGVVIDDRENPVDCDAGLRAPSA